MTNTEKVFHVFVEPAANDRMAEHMEFLARVSEDAANRLLDEMIECVQSLKKMPYRNPFYNRPYLIIDKYRSLLFGNGRYRIVYQISGDYVFIDDIQDCRQSDDKSVIS